VRSLTLSLSLSHTHTHTHSLSLSLLHSLSLFVDEVKMQLLQIPHYNNEVTFYKEKDKLMFLKLLYFSGALCQGQSFKKMLF